MRPLTGPSTDANSCAVMGVYMEWELSCKRRKGWIRACSGVNPAPTGGTSQRVGVKGGFRTPVTLPSLERDIGVDVNPALSVQDP